MTRDELAELTSEKNLWQVYSQVVRKLPGRRLYRAIIAAAGVLTLLGALLSPASLVDLGARFRAFSGAMFGFASSVVGIVLAGFTILTTLSASDIVSPLARHRHKTSGLPWLKWIAAHFLHVFIWYLAFLFFHGFVLAFGWYQGPATWLATWLAGSVGVWLPRSLAAVCFGVLGAWAALLFVTLQSFVFNVYASFMIMVRTKLELERLTLSAPAPASRLQRRQGWAESKGGT